MTLLRAYHLCRLPMAINELCFRPIKMARKSEPTSFVRPCR
ncbi:hypothetical protein [Synechococcus sp. M16CYN]